MLIRKIGMRMTSVLLLFAFTASLIALQAAATAEEPVEECPVLYITKEKEALPEKENPHRFIAESIQKNPRFSMPSLTPPCRNALLVSIDTGDILYEKDPDQKVPMASITKVMTLLLTLEAVEAGKISMTDIVPISEHAYNMGGSQIWLEPGEEFTLDELIKAICVCSANDAAVAVAEYVGGSEPVFAQMMNARAQELGMKNTHFVNACGLDANEHYSSARDVAIMSLALLRHPRILEYSSIWTDTLRGGQTQLTNTNKMLRTYRGITGLKTGTTNGAGVCISASAVREGTGLLVVVLGSPSSKERFAAAAQLLDYGFASYEAVPFPQLEPAAPIRMPIAGGVVQDTGLEYDVPNRLLVKKGEAKQLKTELSLPEHLEAPVRQGDTIGTVTLKLAEETLGEYPVLNAKDVPRMDWNTALSLLTKSLFVL